MAYQDAWNRRENCRRLEERHRVVSDWRSGHASDYCNGRAGIHDPVKERNKGDENRQPDEECMQGVVSMNRRSQRGWPRARRPYDCLRVIPSERG